MPRSSCDESLTRARLCDRISGRASGFGAVRAVRVRETLMMLGSRQSGVARVPPGYPPQAECAWRDARRERLAPGPFRRLRVLLLAAAAREAAPAANRVRPD